MKKLTFLMLLVVGLVNTNQAQDYYHGGGFNLNYGILNYAYTSPDVDFSGVEGLTSPGLMYKATLALTDAKGPKFAVSAYPNLSLSLSANSRTGGSGSFGIELPVNAEVYFGEFDDGAFFAGAGYSYAFMASSFQGRAVFTGPQIDLGGQFYVRDNLFGLRLAYSHGINKFKNLDPDINMTKDSRFMISFGGYYMFGM